VSLISSIGSEEQIRAMKSTRRKLVLQESGSEEADIIETPLQKQFTRS